MIILIGGEKGGTGKTTIAVNLATKRSFTKNVLLINADRQNTATNWYHLRDDNKKIGFYCQRMLYKDMQKLDKNTFSSYDDVIIDVAGSDNPELRFTLAFADKLYIPIIPNSFDTHTLLDMRHILDRLEKITKKVTTKVILNNIYRMTHSQKDRIEYTRATMNRWKFEEACTTLKHHDMYPESQRRNLSIFELKGRIKNKQILNQFTMLYNEVFNE